MSKILVTAKVNPDLDGTACTLAYSDLLKQQGKDAEGIIFGSPQSEVQYFIQKQNISVPTREDNQVGDWENFILVDASSMKGMPKIVVADQVVEIIDHRKSEPEKEFPNAKIQNELIGAAATIIVERFIQAKLKPQPDHAKLLFGAIYHNTLNFIATNSSERDSAAAKFLEETFNISTTIIQEMFIYSSNKIKNDIKEALKEDAKEFGTSFPTWAYQLIVWDSTILEKKDEIEQAIAELEADLGPKISWLNLVTLEDKKSHIHVDKNVGLFEKAFGLKFSNNWAECPAILRKQLAPKVIEALENAKI